MGASIANLNFGTIQRESTSKMNAKKQNHGYNRARLKNAQDGSIDEIILIDPAELTKIDRKNDYKMGSDKYRDFRKALITPANVELKTDLLRALRPYSPIERRILFRVLVQGQSIEHATSRMRSSSVKWRVWFRMKALPEIRARLRDYLENGKVVS